MVMLEAMDMVVIKIVKGEGNSVEKLTHLVFDEFYPFILITVN
jgi:hypothetical protein